MVVCGGNVQRGGFLWNLFLTLKTLPVVSFKLCWWIKFGTAIGPKIGPDEGVTIAGNHATTDIPALIHFLR